MAKLLNLFSNFSSSIVKALVPSFSGMLRVKAGRPVVNWLLKAILLLKGSITTSLVKVSVSYVRTLHAMLRQSGIVFTVKYLKACTSLLMQAISGEPHRASQDLGVAVARTNRGLPRIIPAVHRMKIRDGDAATIRLWLTFFSIYRVLDYTGKLSIKTIVKPSKAVINHAELKEVTGIFMKEFAIPHIDCSPENLKARPYWISTTSPNSTKSEIQQGGPKTASSALESLLGSICAIGSDKITMKALQNLCNCLGITGTAPYVIGFSRFARRYLTGEVWDGGTSCMPLRTEFTGKLGYKVEPAGKIRVFAMVDSFTQWIMNPLHKELFARLRLLRQDATHDQNSTVKDFTDLLRQGNIKRVYSFDLTAATDRLPVQAQAVILDVLSGREIGAIWASALVERWYQLPLNPWGEKDERSLSSLGYSKSDVENNPYIMTKVHDKEGYEYVRAVRYAVGQPMGALSSWAMLAWSHHIMVSIAAHRVGKVGFSLYLVLGDDLVIADKAVAMSYLKLAKEWDIDINLSKSVISTNGSFEFAKRFIWRYTDVTGLSFKEMAVARHDIRGLSQLFSRISKFREVRISELLGFLGFGYKSLSRITTKYRKLGDRMAKALLLLSYPGEMFSSLSRIEDWLLSPSFNKGGLVSFPQEGLSFIKDLVLSYADTLKHGDLPRNDEEYISYYSKLIWKGEDPKKNRAIVADSVNLQFFYPLMQVLQPWLMELYYDIHESWDSTVVELKDTFEYTEDEDLDVDTLWSNLEELEQIASKVSSTKNYTTLTDVITLNRSTVLKRAEVIRSYIRSLSSKIHV